MTQRRTSVAMQNQILELHTQGRSIRKIAQALKIARNTVRACIRDSGPPSSVPSVVGFAQSQPVPINWEFIATEFNKGVPLKILHKEHAIEVMTYMIFYHRFRRRFPKKPQVTIRLQHNPGEKIFFDFSDGISITDPRTQAKIKTQLFVGTLPWSSYTVGEFTFGQKQPEFFRAIENSFIKLGGTPKYAVVDNLKPGVTRAHIYDPDTNQSFIEFSNHHGFAVLPARPRRPKDKAAVEGAIGIIQKQFFNEVRDQIFYSIFDLNQRFQKYLNELNSAPMKDHDGISREDRFENERPLLQTVNPNSFELSVWKTCKVHPDCHIQVDSKFYSVPHQFVGTTVKARIKINTVEIFTADSDSIAIHAKVKSPDRASTIDAHYPEHQVATARFEVASALRQAQNIGSKTFELFQKVFRDPYPLKSLRRAQGILRLVHKNEVSKADLEYAATQALIFNKTQFNFIRASALHHKVGGTRPRIIKPERDPNLIYLHNNKEP
ncbi:MAG: IS21 family transposase [Bdellovibrionales bacterium]|nr:IS21 family transposase [Bdellovibrionales bacterium]